MQRHVVQRRVVAVALKTSGLLTAGPPSPPVVNGRRPDDGSIGRRRLLIALGFGAANVAVLRKIGSSGSPPADTYRAPDAAPPSEASAPTEAEPALEPAAQAPVVDASAAMSEDDFFDLAIVGGRVIDPASGFDAVANIGIASATVTYITAGSSTLRAAETLDASGLVVSPGFIDILSYGPNGYGEWFKLADGVTTNLGMHGLSRRADRWFAAHTDGSVPVHVGGAYDNAFVRAQHGLDPYDSASPEVLDAILADARDDLRMGFIGLHIEPEYTPGLDTAELMAHADLAARHGVPLCVHARYSDNVAPGTNLQALSELITVARESGAHVHVEHINSTGGTGVMAEALGRMSDAIAEGLAMTACAYPYDFWATRLRSARFNDWQEKYGISYSDLQVAGTSQRLTEATYSQAYQDNSVTAAFAIPPEDVEEALRADFVMIGSDAILEHHHNNHPRATGCFSRVLGRYVRELEVIDLPTALSKMTIQPARLLEGRCPEMRRKGRLGIGADADITILDPDTILDRSTIEHPAKASTGIAWVIVEGTPMLTPDGVREQVLAGRALRSDIGSI